MARRHHMTVGIGGWALLLAAVAFIIYYFTKNGTQSTSTYPAGQAPLDLLSANSGYPPGQAPYDLLSGNTVLTVQQQSPNSPVAINSTSVPRSVGSPVPLFFQPAWSRFIQQA